MRRIDRTPAAPTVPTTIFVASLMPAVPRAVM
jgi:hypothetical protein